MLDESKPPMEPLKRNDMGYSIVSSWQPMRERTGFLRGTPTTVKFSVPILARRFRSIPEAEFTSYNKESEPFIENE
jgi:hypothetical protein